MKLLRRRLLLLYAVVCLSVICMFAYAYDTLWISKFIHQGSIIVINVHNTNVPTKEVRAATAIDASIEFNLTLFTGTKLKKLKSRKMSKQLDEFRPVMTIWEQQILYDLMKTLAVVCKSLNSTWFLYGGSLLGSYRHHAIIPWDDDIDLFVNISDRPKLYNALNNLSSEFEAINAGARVKFFSRNSQNTSRFQWKWPYIDIHFFKENATHILDSSSDFHSYIYPKGITFPLHARPLGGMFVNAPFDSYATLLATYRDFNKCSTYHYSHKFEKIIGRPLVRMSCSKLRYTYPFVHRNASANGVTETLIFNRKIVHSLLINEPEYAVPSPYTLRLN